MQVLKLWWMAFWRITLFCVFFQAFDSKTAFILALIVALVVRFGFGYTVKTWPIIRMVTGGDALDQIRFTPLRSSTRSSAPSTKSSAPRTATKQASTRTPQVWRVAADEDRLYAPGQITGYEPRTIESVRLPYSGKMHGTPGKGLDSSNFSDTAISLGKRGEINFAKTLSVARHSAGLPLISKIHSFWSVAMPSKDSASKRDPDFNSDIDCIIVSSDTIYLIDVKFYPSGNVAYETYEDTLYCIDLATNKEAAPSKKMSRNMEMAQSRFETLFPKMKVASRVVFMPTDKGIPRVEGVCWPGGIPAVGLMGMLAELSTLDSAYNSSEGRSAAHKIEQLLK